MAKNSDAKVSKKDEAGSVPVSKNQRNKAAHVNRAAKSGKVNNHGGVCSSCGQVSTSCTTNALHDTCPGFVKDYDFQDPFLNLVGETEAMLADGNIIPCRVSGRWITNDELLRRRANNREYAIKRARKFVVLTPIYKAKVIEDSKLGVSIKDDGNIETVFSHVAFTNGLGDPITWLAGGWRTEEEVAEYQIASEQDAAQGAVVAVNDTAEKSVEIQSAA